MIIGNQWSNAASLGRKILRHVLSKCSEILQGNWTLVAHSSILLNYIGSFLWSIRRYTILIQRVWLSTPGVSSFKVYLSPRAVSLEAIPFMGSPYVMTSWDEDTKVRPFWSHTGWCWWAIFASELTARVTKALSGLHCSVTAQSYFLFPSFRRRFLRNILYPKLCLESASRKVYNTFFLTFSPLHFGS